MKKKWLIKLSSILGCFGLCGAFALSSLIDYKQNTEEVGASYVPLVSYNGSFDGMFYTSYEESKNTLTSNYVIGVSEDSSNSQYTYSYTFNLTISRILILDGSKQGYYLLFTDANNSNYTMNYHYETNIAYTYAQVQVYQIKWFGPGTIKQFRFRIVYTLFQSNITDYNDTSQYLEVVQTYTTDGSNYKVQCFNNNNQLVSFDDDIIWYFEQSDIYDLVLSNNQLLNIFASDNDFYNQGYNDGYASGVVEGTNSGYQTGYNDGLSQAEANNVEELQSTYSQGYSAGYSAGQNEDATVSSIFGGIATVAMVPINFFLSIFNFEILGVNIAAVVSALLSICIIIIVWRTVMGGKGND